MTYFILFSKLIGKEEAVNYAKAIASNRTLTEFNASGHSIGIEGVKAFANALTTNTTLKKVYPHT